MPILLILLQPFITNKCNHNSSSPPVFVYAISVCVLAVCNGVWEFVCQPCDWPALSV